MSTYYYAEVDVDTSLDLWRFASKQERDEFVGKRDHATPISSKSARENHKEQFKFWADNEA